MKLIARIAVLVSTAVAASAALAAQYPASVTQAIERIERGLLPAVVVKGRPAARALPERLRELKVPGISMAVFREGRVEWARGWGYADVEARRPVAPDTLFQAASISKPVAAAVVLSLVSQGKLALDAPVNSYLRSWKVPDNEHTAAKAVTLRHLLTHSAGTTVHGFRGYASGEAVPTLLQLLDGLKPANSAAVRVDIPVGSRWRYSGGGISIAQLAVEEVTKRPFAEVARELVLEPFGMTSSTYVQPLPDDLRSGAATGYRASGDAVAGKWHTYPEQAAAGLWTTPQDLARFAIELQRVATGTSNKVMSRTLAQDMLRRQVGEWGLGVGVLGDGAATRFSHGGANEGFRAFWVGYRDTGSGVVVMTNSDNGAAVWNDLVRAAAVEYGFAGLGPVERILGTADPKTYPDFAGFYDMPNRRPPFLHVVAEGDKLFLSTGPRPDQRTELLPEAPDTFFALIADLRFEFVRDADGRVTEARVWQNGEERRAPRSSARR